jgi:malate dehydrogenase (oxaloacetate-decarboxylating)
LIGLSSPGSFTPEQIAAMAPGAIVFALSNPTPEVMPELMPDNVRIVATGRSDYPNQINNALVFPGIFRGALDARASAINSEMKVAAANAIADMVEPNLLHEDYIIPTPLNPAVAPRVAEAVAAAAQSTRVSRREPAELASLQPSS